MKSLRLNEPGQFELIDNEKPIIKKPNDVLLKIRKIGICGTDLHAYKGRQPFFEYPKVLGHELAAEVVEIGEAVTNIKVGDHCTVEPYRNIGNGQEVKMGKQNTGNDLRVLGVHEDGGMCEYLVYPEAFLHVNNHVSLEQLAMVEPLAIGCHAVERANIKPTDIVLVIGAGPIGLGIVSFAQLKGAKIVVMDTNKNRLNKCRENLNIHRTIHDVKNATTYLLEILDGNLPTIIIDATGHKGSMENTFNLVSAGGSIVFVGLFPGEVHFNDPNFHKKELTLLASRAAKEKDFIKILNLMEVGKIDPSFWISKEMQLEEVSQSFDSLFDTENQIIKAIITI